MLHIASGVRYNSVVEHLLMVQLVVRSIPHGGPTELFLVPFCGMVAVFPL